jgi:hypothetical protein
MNEELGHMTVFTTACSSSIIAMESVTAHQNSQPIKNETHPQTMDRGLSVLLLHQINYSWFDAIAYSVGTVYLAAFLA